MSDFKNKLIDILQRINNWPLKFHNKYGLLGLVASLVVPLKIWIFYSFIGVSSNLIFVWLLTCILTLLLFKSFKNKWIPAGIFLAISVLMFADVTYSNFFNRYLSVNVLGSAGFLGEITESIKAVLKPQYVIIFLDNIFVFASLVYYKINRKKGNIQVEAEPKPEQVVSEAEPIIEDPFLLFLKERKGKLSEKISRRIKKMGRVMLRNKSPFIGLVIIVLVVANITGSGMITSLSNQEVYTYHIKDIASAVRDSGNFGVEGVSAIEKSYENEKEGPLFGIGKGKNLIVIQIESLQDFVVGMNYNGQDVTPNINALIKDQGTIYFDNFFQQVGSGNTSDAELAVNNSIFGSLTSYSYKNYQNNTYRGLPVLLKEKGYNTAVFHAYEDKSFWNRENIYPNLGFDKFYGGLKGIENDSYDSTNYMGWGLPDDEFFRQSMEHIKKIPQPFYNFMITLSNHHPYEMQDQFKFINLLPADRNTLVGNYLNSAAYTDYCIGQFIDNLKKEGLYDNTIIAMYGDHLGLTLKDPKISESMTRLLGKKYDYQDMMSVPLIIHVPNVEKNINQVITKSAGQLDFLPTMAYLMGFDTLDTLYLGHNALTEKKGFVAEQAYMTKGSFFQDDIVYEMSKDGVFENGRAYNQKTGANVPVEDCYDGYLKSMDIINASEYILKNNAIKKMYVDGDKAVNVFKETKAAKYPEEIIGSGFPNQSLVGTNSLEALNASYDAGYRQISVDINWTSEVGARTAILMGDWTDFPKYYKSDRTAEMTIGEYKNIPMKNGLTSMDYFQLAEWMVAHPDVTIVANIDRSADFFMKIMSEYSEFAVNRITPHVNGMVEYSGLYNGILNIDKGNYKPEQLLEFMELNNVWACSMTESAAKDKYKSLLKSKFTVYTYDSKTGALVKKN